MATVEERPIVVGRLKHEEDARFVRARGTRVDDVQLPRMPGGAMQWKVA